MNNPTYISKDDLRKFYWDSSELINPEDLGWWLECKTGNKYTVIEREFIIQTLNTFDEISNNTAATIQAFKKQWLKKLHTLRRAGGYKIEG